MAGVRALIEEGANVNEADNDGRTPLYMAASNAPPGIFGATPAANSSGSVRVSMPFSGGFGGGGAFWGGNSPGACRVLWRSSGVPVWRASCLSFGVLSPNLKLSLRHNFHTVERFQRPWRNSLAIRRAKFFNTASGISIRWQ